MKRYTKTTSVLIFLLSICLGKISAQGVDDLKTKLLPSYGDWKLSSDFQLYNPENLYDFIDGAADSYLAYDFEGLLVATYEKGDKYINIEIYQHSNPTNAFGIYSVERPQKSLFKQIGTQGYQEGSMINFLDGRYYIKISSHDTGGETQNIISNIATDLVKNLSVSADFPAELKLFPDEGKISNSEGYINISFLSYEFLKKAFTCNYGTPEKQFKLFIIHASTDDEARKILTDYLKFAKQEFNGTEGRYIVKDPYNGDIPLEWKGKYIWGIVNDKKVKIKPDYIQLIQNQIENSPSAK